MKTPASQEAAAHRTRVMKNNVQPETHLLVSFTVSTLLSFCLFSVFVTFGSDFLVNLRINLRLYYI